nr:MAG TPA: Putative metallopeptidase domain protein [Caudoviricetes sp.]
MKTITNIIELKQALDRSQTLLESRIGGLNSRTSSNTRWEDYDYIELPDGERIDMKKLLNDQRLAKTALNTRLPHVGILAEKLRFIYTFEVETQATDGYNVFVNPKFTNDLTMEGKMFVMAHELIHCLLNHVRRGQAIGAMNQKGNIAADYEVNQLLVDMGLVSEKFVKELGGYIDSQWQNTPFEVIYNKMKDEKPSQQQHQGGQSGNQQQQQGGSGGGNQNQQTQQNSQNQNQGQSGSQGGNQNQQSGNSGSQGNQSQSQQPSGNQSQQTQQGSGNQSVSQHQQGQQGGSGSSGGSGNQVIQQQGNGNQGSQGPTEYTDEKGNSVRRVTPQDCQGSNRNAQNGRGSMNGSDMMSRAEGDKLAEREGYDKGDGHSQEVTEKEWAKTAEEVAKKIPGHQQGASSLKNIINSTRITDDGTWKKKLKDIVGRSISPESKRRGFTHQNTLASQARLALTDFTNYDNLDYIVALVDTSGSMSQDFLKACLTEVVRIADAKKPNGVIVAQFDTRVADLQIYRNSVEFKKNFKKITIKGGGGTDIKDAFELPKHKNKEYAKKWPKGNIPDLCVVFTDGYLNQYKRPNQLCKTLLWVIIDNPGFELENKEPNTKIIYISKEQAQKW